MINGSYNPTAMIIDLYIPMIYDPKRVAIYIPIIYNLYPYSSNPSMIYVSL